MATLALLVAASLAGLSVALATRAWWGGKGGSGASASGGLEAVGPQGTAPGVSSAGAQGKRSKGGGHLGAAGFQPDPAGAHPGSGGTLSSPSPPSPPLSDEQAAGSDLTIPPAPAVPPERRIHLFDEGKVQVVRDDDARVAGYSIIDLSDDWVPFIFKEVTPGKDDFKKNDYRQSFLKIANDQADESGEPLPPGQHNFVELFGIPPSLSVVRRRFLEDEARDCYGSLRPQVLKGYRGVVKYEGSDGARAILERFNELKSQVQKAMKQTGAPSVEALSKRGHAFLSRQYRLYQTKLGVIHQAQLRLHCEGLYGPGEKVRSMLFDNSMHLALARFERKHKLFGYGQLFGRTLRVLSRTPRENNFATFRRVVTERVVHSLGIIEDGTAPPEAEGAQGPLTWAMAQRFQRGTKDKSKAPKGTDLVGTYTAKVLEAMGLDTPEKVLELMRSQPPEIFERFRVGVKLPPRPDYYSENMSFEVLIDRGDVWYDPPYTPTGKSRGFPRNNLPSLTLFAVEGERRIPLVRYPTTVGGWRTEYKDGKEYYAYKGSDVGPRIWRDIVAGPVWIPPATTSPKSLVKTERRGGKWIRRVNTEEIGPSYASAYGLVVAYHIEENRAGGRTTWRDHGIRTHGSVDYMSILTRYSHGCHRLHNHLAVRLFSFILRHSPYVRRGQVPLAYARRISVAGQNYTIRLDTRGYYYTLRQPVRVTVTEGRIMGQQKTPYDHYLPIPGKSYDSDDPNLKATAKVESEAKDSTDGYKPSETPSPEAARPAPGPAPASALDSGADHSAPAGASPGVGSGPRSGAAAGASARPASGAPAPRGGDAAATEPSQGGFKPLDPARVPPPPPVRPAP